MGYDLRDGDFRHVDEGEQEHHHDERPEHDAHRPVAIRVADELDVLFIIFAVGDGERARDHEPELVNHARDDHARERPATEPGHGQCAEQVRVLLAKVRDDGACFVHFERDFDCSVRA